MARIRSIHPGLFTDEAFVSLSMAARVFLPGVWSESDDHGVFEWKPITLKMKIFPADNVDVGALLVELLNLGMVKKFTLNGKDFGVVRNFAKYQHPKNPSYRYKLPDEYREYSGLKPEATTALPEASPSPTEIPPQMKEEVGSRREEDKKETRARRAWPFNEFWLRFPNKVGRRAAEKAFERVEKSGRVTFDELMAGLERYVHKTDDRPWCNPATWLNQERWTDQPAAMPVRGPPRRQTGFLDVALEISGNEHESDFTSEPIAIAGPRSEGDG